MISIVTSSSPRARCKPGRENVWNPMAMWSATTLNVQQVPEAFLSRYQTFWMKMFTAVGPHSSEIFSQQKISHTVRNICGPHYIGAGLKYVGALKFYILWLWQPGVLHFVFNGLRSSQSFHLVEWQETCTVRVIFSWCCLYYEDGAFWIICFLMNCQ